MGDPLQEEWITETVAGKSFVDVGGLWGTVNEQVSTADRAGATSTTMIDVAPDPGDNGNLWHLFRERMAALGITNTTCLEGNIDDPALATSAGTFDVVHCNGVLYHCPEPLHTLRQLRALTRETLILGTATMPETVSATGGTVSAEQGAALLVPALSERQRAVMGEWLRENGAIQALGVNYPMQTDWAADDYSAWWWFFTPDHVAALLRVAGFEIRRSESYWQGRATLYMATPTGAAG